MFCCPRDGEVLPTVGKTKYIGVFIDCDAHDIDDILYVINRIMAHLEGGRTPHLSNRGLGAQLTLPSLSGQIGQPIRAHPLFHPF